MQQPTPEMIASFKRDTDKHITSVRANLAAIAPVTPYEHELIERGKQHDVSKYSPEEFLPYVWRLERIRRRRKGVPFT